MELAEVWARSERNLKTKQTQADSNRDLPHSGVWDRTRLHLLLSAKHQKRQNIELTIAGLRTRASNQSNLADTAREDLHSTMRRGYDSSFRYVMAQVAGRISNCDVEYHSDVDTQLRWLSQL